MIETDAKLIGARIRTAMTVRGMNQRELAKRAGLTEGAVSRYVNGMRAPDARTVVRLAKVLTVTTDYILGVGRGLE